MSRIAKEPVIIPADVDIHLKGQGLTVKGRKGTLQLNIHPLVHIEEEQKDLHCLKLRAISTEKLSIALSGTMRALVANMVHGVHEGFERSLELRGVGYRAQISDKQLHLSLGFSHPVHYTIPEDVEITTPSQTEIRIVGPDKQLVGQVAATIRAYRPPKCYGGKGVRYKGEQVILKEVKKK